MPYKDDGDSNEGEEEENNKKSDLVAEAGQGNKFSLSSIFIVLSGCFNERLKTRRESTV